MELIKHLCRALSDIILPLILEGHISCAPGKSQPPVKICLPVRRKGCSLRGQGNERAVEGPWGGSLVTFLRDVGL